MRNKLLNLLLVLVSLALSLAAVECIMRATEPPEIRRIAKDIRSHISRHPAFQGIFTYDPVFGWSNVPGATGTYKNKEAENSVRVNREGMRYREVGEKKGFRVAVLGDSYAWGYGVEEEDRFSEKIEKQLGIEMLNFAQRGYSPVQYLLQLDKVLSFKPDLVVIVFCLGNDFGDSVVNYRYRAYRPYAVLENGKLDIRGYPIPNRRILMRRLPWLLTNTATGRFIYAYYYDSLPILWPKLWPPLEGEYAFLDGNLDKGMMHMDTPSTRKVIAINEALLVAIKDKLAAHHVPLVILPAPAKAKKEGVIEFNKNAFTALKEQADRHAIPIVDDLHSFPPEDFFDRDPHWNEQGHTKAAQLLVPVIQKYMDQQ